MKKIIIISIMLVLLVGCSGNSNEKNINSITNNVTDNNTASNSTLKENFEEITKSPRKRGTEGEKRALEYISQHMKNYGYDITVQPFDVVPMTFEERAGEDYFDLNPLGKEAVGEAYNLIADLNYESSKKTMIFSAHYDTTEDSIGALDNGGGTAALLEAAKLIREQPLDYNIRVIFFSGEEGGLCGSRFYLSNLTGEEIANIIGCFNVDVVGAKDCREVLMQTYQVKNKGEVEENWITKEFGRINGEYTLLRGSSSDHAPFIMKGIEAVQLATVNPTNSSFNRDLLRQETNTEAVSLVNLQKDVDLIINFMKNVNISAYSD